MYTIVYALKKHYMLRIFLTVALSLAMALAVGSGIHPNSASQITPPASVAPANTGAATDNSAAARLNPAAYNAANSPDQATALDQAIKNLSSLQRDRNSANTDTITNSTSPKTDAAQTTNSTLQNSLSVGYKK